MLRFGQGSAGGSSSQAGGKSAEEAEAAIKRKEKERRKRKVRSAATDSSAPHVMHMHVCRVLIVCGLPSVFARKPSQCLAG